MRLDFSDRLLVLCLFQELQFAARVGPRTGVTTKATKSTKVEFGEFWNQVSRLCPRGLDTLERDFSNQRDKSGRPYPMTRSLIPLSSSCPLGQAARALSIPRTPVRHSGRTTNGCNHEGHEEHEGGVRRNSWKQRDKSGRRLATTRSLDPSCSSCPSWWILHGDYEARAYAVPVAANVDPANA